MAPPAPGLLSTTTCWPSATDSFWATWRPMMSVAPPAGKGITRRMGLAAGQAWAQAPEVAVARLSSSAKVWSSFMVVGRWVVMCCLAGPQRHTCSVRRRSAAPSMELRRLA